MTKTPEQNARAALDHVLTEVLGKDPVDSPEYFNWIDYNKIKSMLELMVVTPATMMQTTYDNNGTMESPTLSMHKNIKILQAFHHFYCTNNNKQFMENDDWMAMTEDEYLDFFFNDYKQSYCVPLSYIEQLVSTLSNMEQQQDNVMTQQEDDDSNPPNPSVPKITTCLFHSTTLMTTMLMFWKTRMMILPLASLIL